MLVELSKSQDVAAGDGTTSVTVLAGALLGCAQRLLEKDIHPTIISESFQKAAVKAEQVLTETAAIPVRGRTSMLRRPRARQPVGALTAAPRAMVCDRWTCATATS